MLQHFFGKNGKKKISSAEFQNMLDIIRQDILKYEFSLYASKHRDSIMTDRSGSVFTWGGRANRSTRNKISLSDFSATLISTMDLERFPFLIQNVQAIQAIPKVLMP